MNGIRDMFPEWTEVLHTTHVGIMPINGKTQSIPARAATNDSQKQKLTDAGPSTMNTTTTSSQPNFRLWTAPTRNPECDKKHNESK